MKKTVFVVTTLILMILPQMAFAGFFTQYSFFYHTNSDDSENFEYSKMNNYLFFGASFDKNKQWYLGQSIHMWSKSHTAGSGSEASEISIMEMGPRFIWFMDKTLHWQISFTYNPYAKGDRTKSGETAEVLSGSSYIFSFGYQLKMSKTFGMGASINYHTFAVSSSTVGTAKEELSESYSHIVPMLEFSLRFK